MASVTMDCALVHSWADTVHESAPSFSSARWNVDQAGYLGANGLAGYASAAAMASFVAGWMPLLDGFATSTTGIAEKLHMSANLVAATDAGAAQDLDSSEMPAQVDVVPDGQTWVGGGI